MLHQVPGYEFCLHLGKYTSSSPQISMTCCLTERTNNSYCLRWDDILSIVTATRTWLPGSTTGEGRYFPPCRRLSLLTWFPVSKSSVSISEGAGWVPHAPNLIVHVGMYISHVLVFREDQGQVYLTYLWQNFHKTLHDSERYPSSMV